MKIVDVCAFYTPHGGGVRTYVEQKLAAGPELGNEIIVIAPGEADRTEVRGPMARIEWVDAPRFPLDRRYRYFSGDHAVHRLLNRIRPDVVEASSPWRTARLVAEWRGSAARSLIMHSDPMASFAYRWLEFIAAPEVVDRRLRWFWDHLRRQAPAFDLVVGANSSLTERLAAAGIDHAITVPMGIESNVFSPRLRDEALRARLLLRCNLGPDATLLLGIGRHAPEKRWPMIVEAVMAAGYDRPLGLVLVGDGRDRSRIIRQIDGNPHIHLISPITDRLELARLMASGDALVHGCESETFSMVAAEAAASGLPLIVPDRGGAADHARIHGGLTYSAGDAGDAARDIQHFIAGKATSSGRPVRTMAAHFSELFGLYRQVTNSRRIAA